MLNLFNKKNIDPEKEKTKISVLISATLFFLGIILIIIISSIKK